jgi:DNA replication protein DnaC
METFGDRIRRLAEQAKADLDAPGSAERVAQLAQESEDEKQRRQDTDRLMFLATSGIPRGFWDLLAMPQETPALTEVRSILTGDGPVCLTLAGRAGNGKTTALAWGTFAKRGTFIHAIDLVQASAFDAHYWVDLRTTPVLAIDELGAEPANVQSQGMIFDLLNRRIENLLPTLIATNLDGGTFSKKYLSGPMERLSDRLKNYGKWVEFTAPSMRKHYDDTEGDL